MYLIGIDVTSQSAVREFPLGSLAMVVEDDGTTGIYMYAQCDASGVGNTGGVAIISGGTGSAGHAATAASVTSSAPGTGQGKYCGVALAAVAANVFAWFKVFGSIQVRVLANCAAWTQLNTTGTANALDDDATAGSEVIDGIVLRSTNGGATAAANAIVNWPRVGRTL